MPAGVPPRECFGLDLAGFECDVTPQFPAQCREIVMPAHNLVCDAFKARGKFMILHICGYMMDLAPLIIEAGFDCLQPI